MALVLALCLLTVQAKQVATLIDSPHSLAAQFCFPTVL